MCVRACVTGIEVCVLLAQWTIHRRRCTGACVWVGGGVCYWHSGRDTGGIQVCVLCVVFYWHGGHDTSSVQVYVCVVCVFVFVCKCVCV